MLFKISQSQWLAFFYLIYLILSYIIIRDIYKILGIFNILINFYNWVLKMSEENNNNINLDEILNSEAGKEKINNLITEALNKQKEEFEKETIGLKNNKEAILKERRALEEKLNKILVDSGNIEEISKRAKEERDNEWSSKFSTINEENEKLKKEINDYKISQKISKLNDIVLKEIKNFNVHAASIEDVQEKFSKEFDLDDSGNLIHKSGKINSSGKKFEVKDFYDELQKSKPHWFNGVSGSGTTITNKGSDKELTKEDISKMSRTEYQAAKKAGKIKF